MEKKLLRICAMFFVALLSLGFTACSENNEDDSIIGGGGGNNNIATHNLKTITLRTSDTYPEDDNTPKGVKVYEEFNYRYYLHLFLGKIAVVPYVRSYGQYSIAYDGSYGKWAYYNIACKDVGVVNSIDEVSQRFNSTSEYSYNAWHGSVSSHKGLPDAQPKHGYAFGMKTDEGIQHMRVYITDYTEDNNGLQTVTVQYQLY